MRAKLREAQRERDDWVHNKGQTGKGGEKQAVMEKQS